MYSIKHIEEIPKNPVPEAGILTFNMGRPLVFLRAPFEEIMYIQNKSHSANIKFSLQVYPTASFNISPSYGLLKAGESMAVKVKFRQNPQMIAQEVNGFVRIRSEFGFPLERYTWQTRLTIIQSQACWL